METLNFSWADEANKIGLLKFNRPKALNALNNQLLDELTDFLKGPALEARVLIFTGEGEKSFVAGADIKEMKDHTPEEAYKMGERGQSILNTIENLNCATIAAVNGFALGGGMEMCLACDMVFASDNAKFGLPEVSLGIIPGYGGTQRLARNIGLQKAKHIVFTGDMFSSEQLKNWGLVCDVFTQDKLMESVLKTAKSISKKGPLAIQSAKRAIHEGFNLNLSEAMKVEAKEFKTIFESKDHLEGINAFIEKRKPEFLGQ